MDIDKTFLSPNALEKKFRPRMTDETKVPFVTTTVCLNFIVYFNKYFKKKLIKGKKAGLSDFFLLRGPSGYGKSYALAYFAFLQRTLKVCRVFYINNPDGLRSNPKDFILRELVYFTHPDSINPRFVACLKSVLNKLKNVSPAADMILEPMEDDQENVNEETFEAWRKVWCDLRDLILESSDAHLLRDLIAELSKYYDKYNIKRILIIDNAHIVYSDEPTTRKEFGVFHEAVDPHCFDSTILCASNNGVIAYSADEKYEDFELDSNVKEGIKSFYEYKEPFEGDEIVLYLKSYLTEDKFNYFYGNNPQALHNLQLTSAITCKIPLQVNHLCVIMNRTPTENQPNFEDLINDSQCKSIELIRNKLQDHLSKNAADDLCNPTLVACIAFVKKRVPLRKC